MDWGGAMLLQAHGLPHHLLPMVLTVMVLYFDGHAALRKAINSNIDVTKTTSPDALLNLEAICDDGSMGTAEHDSTVLYCIFQISVVRQRFNDACHRAFCFLCLYERANLFLA